jgi:4-hydroxy-2-oxoheptanedioate aldolase
VAEIRKNKVKQKIAAGGVGTSISGPSSPDIIDFLGQFGFDSVWIETEHGPIDYADIPDLSRACDLWGMSPLVRVNLNLPGVIYRTLDVGAQGICVPHVDTAEEARAIVDAAKFHPLGSRGMYTSRQGYGVSDYFHKANDQTMIVILIEDIKTMGILDELLEVDNIDVFMFPPSDLAQSMGLLAQTDHPDVEAAIDKAIKQTIAAGRVAGATTFTAEQLDPFLDKGVRFIMTAWQRWIKEPAEEFLAEVAEKSKG